MKNTVIFDLDGTLLNTLQDLMNAVNFAMEKHGLHTWGISDIRAFVGNGVRNLIIRSSGIDENDPRFEPIFSDFKEYYSKHSTDFTRPYDGVIELIQKLKKDGYKTAIVSNKYDGAVKDLQELFFPNLIDTVCGEKEGFRKKPFADTTFEVMKNLNAKADEAVFVGDSDVDFKTAQNAGLDHVIVTWGFRDRCDLEKLGAEVFADTAEELYDRIKNF